MKGLKGIVVICLLMMCITTTVKAMDNQLSTLVQSVNVLNDGPKEARLLWYLENNPGNERVPLKGIFQEIISKQDEKQAEKIMLKVLLGRVEEAKRDCNAALTAKTIKTGGSYYSLIIESFLNANEVNYAKEIAAKSTGYFSPSVTLKGDVLSDILPSGYDFIKEVLVSGHTLNAAISQIQGDFDSAILGYESELLSELKKSFWLTSGSKKTVGNYAVLLYGAYLSVGRKNDADMLKPLLPTKETIVPPLDRYEQLAQEMLQISFALQESIGTDMVYESLTSILADMMSSDVKANNIYQQMVIRLTALVQIEALQVRQMDAILKVLSEK